MKNLHAFLAFNNSFCFSSINCILLFIFIHKCIKSSFGISYGDVSTGSCGFWDEGGGDAPNKDIVLLSIDDILEDVKEDDDDDDDDDDPFDNDISWWLRFCILMIYMDGREFTSLLDRSSSFTFKYDRIMIWKITYNH